MTAEKIREVINFYKTVFDKLGIPAKQFPDYKTTLGNYFDAIGHCHWMIYQVEAFLEAGRIDKANRWLGWIQCTLFSFGIRSLEDLKNDSRPNNNLAEVK